MNEPQTDMEELATIANDESPALGALVDIGGNAPLHITAMKARTLPAFARAIGPALPGISQLIGDDGMNVTDLADLMGDHGDGLIDAVAIGADLDRDAVEDMDLDIFLELALTVLRVNMDFFVKRLLPKVSRQITALTTTMEAAGSTPPNS